MLTTGQILQERYLLDELLSDRPAHQTWLATDLAATAEPTRVVVKLLAVGAKWDELKLFEREAQVLKQLHHPRIPQYYASFRMDDPTLWVGLVETYIPGPNLKTLLSEGKRFTQSDIEQIAQQVLQILKDLHGVNPPVLHRDIKPSNLIWTSDQQIYLVDFGAVQDPAAAQGGSFTVVGTYGYTPMEQFGGRAVPASDLYALGATLIHLLTGVAPADLLQPDLNLKFSDRISLSSDLTSWLQRMTDPNLAQRFSNAEQALAALRRCRRDPKETTKDLNAIQVDQTRILIQPSPTQLEMTIPQQWVGDAVAWPERLLAFGAILGPILTLLPIGTFLLVTSLISLNFARLGIGLLLLIAGLGLCVLGIHLLKRYFESTQIFVTQTSLTVKRQLFGWHYRQQQWQMDQLQSIYALSLGPSNTDIVIQLKGKETPYHIGQKLTSTESDWLIQTIHNWLTQTPDSPQ